VYCERGIPLRFVESIPRGVGRGRVHAGAIEVRLILVFVSSHFPEISSGVVVCGGFVSCAH
jgi:hypothetical protein